MLKLGYRDEVPDTFMPASWYHLVIGYDAGCVDSFMPASWYESYHLVIGYDAGCVDSFMPASWYHLVIGYDAGCVDFVPASHPLLLREPLSLPPLEGSSRDHFLVGTAASCPHVWCVCRPIFVATLREQPTLIWEVCMGRNYF